MGVNWERVASADLHVTYAKRYMDLVRSIYRRDAADHKYAATQAAVLAAGIRKFSESPYRKGQRITVDRDDQRLEGVGKGWTVRYTTDLTDEVWFYLRGEEYSAQIDYFVQSIKARRLDGENVDRLAERARYLSSRLYLFSARRPGAASPV